MKLPSHLWLSRHGIYYLRYTSKNHEIKRSLGTRDPRLAIACAYQFGASLMASPLDKALTALKSGQAKEWKVKLPDGTEVEAGDSDADHKRALEVLALLKQKPINNVALLPPRVDADMTLEKCIDDYMHERDGEFSPGTVRTYKTCFNKLMSGLGKRTPLQQIDSPAFLEFRKKQDATLHPDTVLRDVGAWKGFFDWAIRRGRYEGENPIEAAKFAPAQRARLIRERSSPHNAFDKNDLDRLFNPERMKTLVKPCAFFMPILALYTGARLNEIASLKISDIIEQGAGSWSIKITDSKSAAGVRNIPLHPAIIDTGFINYLSDVLSNWPGASLVFPYLKSASKNGLGNSCGKEFGEMKQGLGLGDDKVFHSFRITLVSCLQYNACADEFRRAYVGHEQSDKRDAHTSYSKADLDCERLREVIFPALDYQRWIDFQMPHLEYQRGQFNNYLAKIRAKQRINEARKKIITK